MDVTVRGAARDNRAGHAKAGGGTRPAQRKHDDNRHQRDGHYGGDQGVLRAHGAHSQLTDINHECARAFWEAKKPDLSQSLRVDEANQKLAVRALRICQILERLNITTLTAEHDYIGALYEEFFRYTGGNTIGQYFTPRHITKLMAELCAIGPHDVVLDPACGTGGFLIAAMERMQKESKPSRAQIISVVQTQLIGLEDEPVTASLCAANMILRGDGSSGVHRADCFDEKRFPADSANTVLMNPPFPTEKPTYRPTPSSTRRSRDCGAEERPQSLCQAACS